MSERDELARVLAEHGFRKWGDRLDDANWVVCLCGEKVEGREKWQTLLARHQAAAILADAILAAGYRKPRTITTAEELDALPNGSIILEVHGTPSRAVKREDGKNWWVDGPDALSSSELIPLPVTVLHEGTQP